MLVKGTVLFMILLVLQHSLSEKTTKKLVGGWSNVSVDDPKVQKLAKEAVKIYANQKHISHKVYELEKVRSAQKQVVAGINYRIDLIARSLNESFVPIRVPLYDSVFVDIKNKAHHNVTVVLPS